jgi:hypothetical protein
MSLAATATGFPGDNYDSTNTKDYLGWSYSSVLLMALPIMLTALAMTVTFAIEVALKIQILSAQPEKLAVGGSIPASTLDGGSGGVPIPGPVPGSAANKYADPSQGVDVPIQPNPNSQLPSITGPNPPVLGVNNQVVVNPITSDTHKSLYVWEEVMILFLFHIVSCSFYSQPRKSSQNALGPILAWIHFVAILGYAFVIVSYSLTFSTRRSTRSGHLHQLCSWLSTGFSLSELSSNED